MRHKVVKFLRSAGGKSGIFAHALDLMTSRSLTGEAQAVSSGMARYLSDQSRQQQSYPLLRRNIHRLEKGLIMRPRRAEFARAFILETVTIYRQLVAGVDRFERDHEELAWAHDVLTEYFACVSSNAPAVRKSRELFESLPKLPEPADDVAHSRPFVRLPASASDISFDSFQRLVSHRRSVRWFLDKPVPHELIDDAIRAARQAPSACNRQSFEFRIFDDPERLKRVIRIPIGTAGFAHNVPAMAVIVGKLRAYPYARDRHAIYVDASLSAMLFALALETMDLGSCFLNWADQEPQQTKIASELGLEPDERVIVSVAFGYPDPEAMVPFSAKRSLDELRSYNR